MKKIWIEPKIDELDIKDQTESTFQYGHTPDGGKWNEGGVPMGDEYAS